MDDFAPPVITDECLVCGWLIRLVRGNKHNASWWTHIRERTGPGPRPWHRAVGPEVSDG